MATTTTNFGWDIPQSTDLVKDGATAIAALGQDIDTAFVDFKGGTTGQVLKKTSNTDLDVEWGTASSGLTLINTTSFSGVSSFSLAANTFSSAYQNYFVQGVLYVDNAANFRLRAAGSDNSTASSYQNEFIFADGNNISGAFSALTSGEIGSSRSGEKLSFEMFIYDVNLAAKTYISNKSIRPPTNMQINDSGVIHTQTVAYDSMTFISSSGNFASGSKVSVYGFNQ
jgi:hypothetical protein